MNEYYVRDYQPSQSNKMSIFGTLGLGFCIKFKILYLQERFNYVFCCAHKEIMFSLGDGND